MCDRPRGSTDPAPDCRISPRALQAKAPMLTTLTPDALTGSVLAVPPLARKADYSLNDAENTRLIRHIESGGVRTLLYGGNANFYHLPLDEYDAVLTYLAHAAG